MFRTREELAELPEDSTDIFKRSMLDRYIDRPNSAFQGGKYTEIDKLCYAEFLSNYYLILKPIEGTNDNQPEILTDNLILINHEAMLLPKTVPLMSTKEKLQCRRVKAILRYHTPNRVKHPEKYSHHVLFMFYPFRKESDLLGSMSGTSCVCMSTSYLNNKYVILLM